jgi:hypothetical protein
MDKEGLPGRVNLRRLEKGGKEAKPVLKFYRKCISGKKEWQTGMVAKAYYNPRYLGVRDREHQGL